jgi:uncharacterized protein (TIGR01244 family)
VAQDPEDIQAWQRLDESTTTSGYLKSEDVGKLAQLGVRHVINLAPDERPGALPGEAELLERLGLSYTYIPVPFDAPNEDHFDAFVEAYESAEAPVHVHCIANWRVSAFFYRYNRDLRGMDEAMARALMEQQWSPEKWDHEMAPAWVRFIAKRGN